MDDTTTEATPADDLMPPWPTEEPDAEALIRYFVGRGQFCLGLSMGAGLYDTTDTVAVLRHLSAIHQMQHACDVVMLLKEAGDQADEQAKRLWLMAESGDCYGEVLWDWGTAAGLDCVGIRAAGEAAVKEERA